MSRENETFRLELEMLREAFPSKAIISRTELMQYTGKGRAWLDAHGFAGKDFTLVNVANKLSKLK